MSVSSTGTSIQYSGNGVTKDFAFPYRFLDAANLSVVVTNPDKSDTPQVLTTNYTVSGAGFPSGGTVSFLIAPVAGQIVTISRETTRTQQVDYIAQDNFPAETHEGALDRLTLQSQDTARKTPKALRIPDTNSDSKVPEMTVQQRTNRVVGFGQDAALDLSVKLDDVRTIIIANPVAALANVTDYGSISDAVTSNADYGSIV
jgi:hypothetical protein